MSEEPNALDELLDLIEPHHYDEKFIIDARKCRNELTARAEAAEARAAELLKRLEDAQAYIGKLEAERAFERTAPVDWRNEYNAETPIGQALDGLGDEVE